MFDSLYFCRWKAAPPVILYLNCEGRLGEEGMYVSDLEYRLTSSCAVVAPPLGSGTPRAPRIGRPVGGRLLSGTAVGDALSVGSDESAPAGVEPGTDMGCVWVSEGGDSLVATATT